MEEHVSLIALRLRVGIGFGGVVSVMILWKKDKDWMMPPKIQLFHGV